MSKKIQRVELNTFYNASVHCPFCGKKVVANEEEVSAAERIHPCRHTVFVACDEGFEYRSPLFDEKLGLVNVADEDIDLPETGAVRSFCRRCGTPLVYEHTRSRHMINIPRELRELREP